MRNTLPLLLIAIVLYSCTQTPYKKEAIELNNKARDYFLTNPDSALILFDNAIALDSTYHLPLQNKVNLLIEKRRYIEALSAIDDLLVLKEYPEVYQIKGMLIEKTGGNIDDASFAYKKALELFDKPSEKRTEKEKFMLNNNLAFTYFLLGDTSQAKQIIINNDTNYENFFPIDSILANMSDKQKIINLILK